MATGICWSQIVHRSFVRFTVHDLFTVNTKPRLKCPARWPLNDHAGRADGDGPLVTSWAQVLLSQSSKVEMSSRALCQHIVLDAQFTEVAISRYSFQQRQGCRRTASLASSNPRDGHFVNSIACGSKTQCEIAGRLFAKTMTVNPLAVCSGGAGGSKQLRVCTHRHITRGWTYEDIAILRTHCDSFLN
jgi:hypothetical protein